MSSPPLNCFFAAARTASLIASITRSRSMPCSWQRASMFCAMLVLILFEFSRRLPVCPGQMPIGFFAFAGPPEFTFDIDFQMRFDNCVDRNQYAATGAIIEDHVSSIDSGKPTAKVPLPVYCEARFDPRISAGELLVISQPVQSAFKSRRRNLQRVRRMDKILHVEHCAELIAHL